MAFQASQRVLVVLLLAGCGGAPAPTSRVASSEAAIRGATEVGAQNIPRAALHLKLAQEEVEKAKTLIRDDDNARATTMLMRAQADAELAIALAREEEAKAAAQRALAEVQELKKKAP